MLPKIIDNDTAYRFRATQHQGFCIVFASREAFQRVTHIRALWVREVKDARTLLALQRWVAVRRDHWDAWGRMAETVTQPAFVEHMERLLQHSPIGEVVGTLVRRDDTDDCAVTLGETLHGHSGLQFEELYRHRFASPRMRERFYEWLQTGGNLRAAEELVRVAFNVGTDVVAGALDAIAEKMPVAVAAAPAAGAGRPRRRVR